MSGDDEHAAGITRRFSRSVSLQEPLFNFKEKRVFSGLPETTHGWPEYSPAPAPSDEDAWNLIYAAAAGQVARMKMKTSISSVAGSGDRGVIGAPPLFRQQHFCRNRCVPAAAWPPPQYQNHQNQQKQVVGGGSGGGCDDGGAPAAKRGTGVFLPRRYCTNPPESRKRQANLPARIIQSPTPPPQIPPHIYEMLVSRRKAMISGAQRRQSNVHGGVMESAVNNPEVLLPQEWTY